MSRKDTLDKAYGNIPKEVGMNPNTVWFTSFRGFKYYLLILVKRLKYTR